jgi:hypothetical protein
MFTYPDGMKLGVHTCTLLVGTLALTACGSGPISLEDGSDESDSDTDDTDGPEDLACVDEDGLVPGVLRLDPTLDRAWVIDGATETELELTGPDEPAWLLGAAAGDRIAVARIVGAFDDQDSIVHAYARGSGELLWTREYAGVGVSQMWVAEDGALAGTVSQVVPGARVGFVMTDVDVFELPDHQPIAAPALGHVAVHELGGQGTRVATGWIDLTDHSWQSAMPEPTEPSVTVAQDGHTLEYLVQAQGVAAFVRARPGEAETITLPLEPLEGHSLHITASAGNYRVVRRYDPNSAAIVHVRVDLEGNDAVSVDPVPPPGWSFFDCYDRRVSVDGDGRLVFELRNDASARPWAYDVDEDTWTQLGQGLGLVDDIDVTAQSKDVLLVRGTAQFQTFCPPTEWAQAPDDALVGDSVQLVRSEPALTMTLPSNTWEVMIDRQQRCAAVAGENGWQVRALDGSDAVIDVGTSGGTWQWLD